MLHDSVRSARLALQLMYARQCAEDSSHTLRFALQLEGAVINRDPFRVSHHLSSTWFLFLPTRIAELRCRQHDERVVQIGVVVVG